MKKEGDLLISLTTDLFTREISRELVHLLRSMYLQSVINDLLSGVITLFLFHRASFELDELQLIPWYSEVHKWYMWVIRLRR